MFQYTQTNHTGPRAQTVRRLLAVKRAQRGSRVKFSPTAIKIRFTRYLLEELRAKSILSQAENTNDCSVLLGHFPARATRQHRMVYGDTLWTLALRCVPQSTRAGGTQRGEDDALP